MFILHMYLANIFKLFVPIRCVLLYPESQKLWSYWAESSWLELGYIGEELLRDLGETRGKSLEILGILGYYLGKFLENREKLEG